MLHTGENCGGCRKWLTELPEGRCIVILGGCLMHSMINMHCEKQNDTPFRKPTDGLE